MVNQVTMTKELDLINFLITSSLWNMYPSTMKHFSPLLVRETFTSILKFMLSPLDLDMK